MPRIQLGGWWRIWIVLTSIWIGIAAVVLINGWPRAELAGHSDWYVSALQLEYQERLVTDTAQLGQFDQSEITLVSMPNGHRLMFKPGVTNSEMKEVADAYAREARMAQDIEKQTMLSFIAWFSLTPPLSLLFIGAAIGWIRLGFKSTKSNATSRS